VYFEEGNDTAHTATNSVCVLQDIFDNRIIMCKIFEN